MKLGNVIHKWRVSSDVTIRPLSKEIGVSPATLHRFESGKPIDSGTFAKILVWLTR